MPDFDSFNRISYTTDFSAFCSVGLAGFVGGELSLSKHKNSVGLRVSLRPRSMLVFVRVFGQDVLGKTFGQDVGG